MNEKQIDEMLDDEFERQKRSQEQLRELPLHSVGIGLRHLAVAQSVGLDDEYVQSLHRFMTS